YFMRKFCQAKYESFANWAETQRICLNFRHALAGAPEPCPYRQMVRGARGKRALVYPGLHRFKVGRGKDTVEFCDGAAAVKAVPGVDEPMMLGEIGKAAPAIAPLIAIPHQDGGKRLALRDMGKDGARLLPAAEPRNVEVHADHAQPCLADA